MFDPLVAKQVTVLAPCLVISQSDEFLQTKYTVITQDGQASGTANSFEQAVAQGKLRALQMGINF